ncbi:FMN-binding negative transcriptional regulator [Uliginosibacterium sp. H3]|uniref:FMN-binding negative transcriptional regulator n=1 Tax=Uliginosibacterium silvisoli TaxID=3114758 RepID=A0ABU6JZ87_9RHOO|nr:FMN-binding negative transcriptional regulator [Uliginosibacterium sp. H3]
MLYTPPRFVETNPDIIRELITAAPFAMLISSVEGAPIVTHAPVVLDEAAGKNWFAAHVARANPHSAALGDGAEVLVVFNGPHSYISPGWYQEASVPTWNYAVVHLRCRVHVRSGDDAQALLDTLASTFEDTGQPGHLSREGRARMLNYIHCFALEPLQVEAKFKLSQDESKIDQQRIVTRLAQLEDENAQGVANLMLRNLAAGFGG